MNDLPEQGKWPCLFSASDTTGEKDFEEFYTANEVLDMERLDTIGVIKNVAAFDEGRLDHFIEGIAKLRAGAIWDKPAIVDLFNYMIPDFKHKDTGKYLDGRM